METETPSLRAGSERYLFMLVIMVFIVAFALVRTKTKVICFCWYRYDMFVKGTVSRDSPRHFFLSYLTQLGP